MVIKKTLAIVLASLLLPLPVYGQEAASTEGSPATQEKESTVGEAKQAPKPLSIQDLQNAFKKNGLPDEEVVRSTGLASPLTPDQIRAIRQYVDQVRRASSEPPTPFPKPSVSSRTISLEPGTQPSVVRLHSGIVTSIVFQDLTGSPWPVKSIFTGNKDWEVSKAEGSNIIMISPLVEYSESNMSILLDGAPAPVMLTLKSGKNDEADHRLDLVVQARGPRAAAISMDIGSVSSTPDYLISFQDGVPPQDAKSVRVRNTEGLQVWRYNGKLVARTRMTLAAPESPKAIRSADGMFVYEIEETPVAYFTFGGKRFRADIDI